MIVAVTGSRAILPLPHWEQILREHLETATVLVHGACPHPREPKIQLARSIDMWADEIALEYPQIEIIRFKADWSRGRRAGPERNARMAMWCARHADPDRRLLAFPGNRGTASCVDEFMRVGITVRRIS
jgi:hypothetical protein